MPSKREHSKSRLGCIQCKSRRIKCDEVPPRCGPCTKKGIECEYASLSTIQTTINILTQASFASPAKRSAASSTASTASPPVESSETRLERGFSSDDMLLMHYFTLHTSRTIGVLDEEEYHDIWQTRVPQMACRNRYLMHAVLGITAAHRSDLKTTRHHYSRAISAFTASDQTALSADQADSIFCYCVLIMLITVALECKDCEGISDPVVGVVNFFNAARTAVPMLKIFEAGLLRGQVRGLLRHMSMTLEPHRIPDDLNVSLDLIGSLIAAGSQQATVEENEALSAALMNLRHFFRVVKLRPDSWAYIMQWPLKLKAEYLVLLQQGHPAALAMLAHWCVPLHHAPQKWFSGGWPKELILAVVEKLNQSELRDVVAWPKSQVA